LLAEREDRIGCPSDFKGPHLLKVFTLEENLCIAHFIQGAAGEDRGAVDIGSDPLSSLSHVLYCGFGRHSKSPLIFALILAFKRLLLL
jgi:hypothetical protein